jgi:hypothetical protein
VIRERELRVVPKRKNLEKGEASRNEEGGMEVKRVRQNVRQERKWDVVHYISGRTRPKTIFEWVKEKQPDTGFFTM